MSGMPFVTLLCFRLLRCVDYGGVNVFHVSFVCLFFGVGVCVNICVVYIFIFLGLV